MCGLDIVHHDVDGLVLNAISFGQFIQVGTQANGRIIFGIDDGEFADIG